MDQETQMGDMHVMQNDHSLRINRLEVDVRDMKVSQARVEETVFYIKAKLDNGITTKLEKLTENMSVIKPIIEERNDLHKTIRNAILILAISGGASLLLFVMKEYFVRQ